MNHPSEAVFEPVPSTDVRELPLSAVDGFVLSRIDGRSSLSDIVAMTGLPSAQVANIVDKLIKLGAARLRRPSAPHSRPGSIESSARPRGRTNSSIRSSGRRRSSQSLAPPRRMWSESSIAAPPPDMRAYSTRPSAPAEAPSVPPASRAEPQRQPSARGGSIPAATSTAPPIENARLDVVVTQRPAPVTYDAAELDEEVELPLERQKQVLNLYHALSSLDYYEALGVGMDADRKAIRAAYFKLSKVFHPDSMFRKELGSFKAKMEACFTFLTEGYELLSKKQRRAEYDAYLRATQATKHAERALVEQGETMLEGAVPGPPRMPAEAQAPAQGLPSEPSSSPSAGSSTPPRRGSVSPEARKLAQAVIARRLKGVSTKHPEMQGGVSEPPTPVNPSASSPEPGAPPQDLLRRLTRALKDAGEHAAGGESAGRHERAAKVAEQRGDLKEALRCLGRAMSSAPERPDLQAEYARLSQLSAQSMADEYLAQAEFETKQGKWGSAALNWAKVCEGRPDDVRAHRAAAHALLKAGGDLRGAQKYAQRAVLLSSDDLDARLILAQVYLTLGLSRNARRELDAVVKLDPKNEMGKNLLRELKG